MTDINKTDIFVFGSNLAGRHGKGAALFAKNHRGAIYGKGIGLQGESYAIPTKDAKLKTLTLIDIQKYIIDFIEFARENQNMNFKVTPIGCGLAGYKPCDIAPLFDVENLPDNILLPYEFLIVLEKL
jgi:hypothetical protein